MRIDLHTHTQNLKSGDGSQRVIIPKNYVKKMQNLDVGICAITNHNKFDLDEYREVRQLNEDLLVFPGIELDIKMTDGKNRQIIAVGNPDKAAEFKEAYDSDSSRQYNVFSMPYEEFINVTKKLGPDNVIIIPHFYNKAKGLSRKEKDKLEDDLKNFVIILEPSNITSMGIINNHEERPCLVGSDVNDWSSYSKDMIPELKFKIASFSRFYELAKNPKVFVKNALSDEKCHDVNIGESVLAIYEDINIIFGGKGSGKTYLLKNYIQPHLNKQGKKVFLHEGKNYDDYYTQMLSRHEKEVVIDDNYKNSIIKELSNVLGYSEPSSSNFIKEYMDSVKCKATNKKAQRILKAAASFSDDFSHSIDEVIGISEEYVKKINEVRKINADIRNDSKSTDRISLDKELDKLQNEVFDKTALKVKKMLSYRWTESFLSGLKDAIHKNSGVSNPPTNIGLSKLIAARLNRLESNRILIDALSKIKKSDSKTIGYLPEKEYIEHEVEIICLSTEDKYGKDSVFDKNRIVTNRRIIEKIYNFSARDFRNINKYYDVNEKNIEPSTLANDIIKKSSSIKLKNGEPYEPSDGEKAILSISGVLEDRNHDCYIFDEIERGLGHKYIADYLVPKLKKLRDAGKTIVLSTHDANIAVNTLPSQTVYCCHGDNDLNDYYCGNMYSNELSGIINKSTIDWDKEAIVHLEGGRDMFNSRRNVYGQQ